MHEDKVFDDGIVICSERPEHYDEINEVVTLAFKEKEKDTLIEETRKMDTFNKDYSIVALCDGKVVGHILLNTVFIESPSDSVKCVIIAPLAVHPEYQARKIGSRLVNEAIKRAKEDGMPFIMVMGGPYYEKFGFTDYAHLHGIFRPHPIKGTQYVRIMELRENGIGKTMGVIKYPRSFKHTVERWW